MKHTKKILSCAICTTLISSISADEGQAPMLVLPVGVGSSATSVQTSMHDSGSAAANYTLGSGGSSSVQTTQGYSSESSSGNTASYSETKYDSQPRATSGSSSVTRRRSSRRSSYVAPTTSHGSEKDAKSVIIPEEHDPSPLIITAEAGYQSQYVYHGLNRIRLVSFDNGASGVDDDFDAFYVGANLKWKGFSVGLKYIESLDSNINPLFHPTTTFEDSYSEYVFDVNYTLGLVAGPSGEGNWLDLTVGYEFTYFPEDTFWNTDSQYKFYVQLKSNRYKWFRPSVSYEWIESGDTLNSGTIAPGFDLLSGEQLIFQIDGGDVIYDGGNYTVSAGYYAKAGRGSDYSIPEIFDEEWYQAGISLPISINNFTITPSVNYTDHGNEFLEDPEFWWGINAKYTF